MDFITCHPLNVSIKPQCLSPQGVSMRNCHAKVFFLLLCNQHITHQTQKKRKWEVMFGMKWHLCKDISFLISVYIVAVICIIAAQQLEEHCMHYFQEFCGIWLEYRYNSLRDCQNHKELLDLWINTHFVFSFIIKWELVISSTAI